jgi:hypothetical protein
MKFGVDNGWGQFLEQLIAPFLSAIAFVISGTSISPKFKLKISYLLAGLWICGTVLGTIYIVMSGNGEPKYYGLAPIGGIIGSIVGAWNIKQHLTNETNS